MSLPRIVTDRFLSGRLVGSGLGLAERIARWPADRLTVLTYHRIDEINDDRRDPSLISATPTQFERQIAHLRENCSLVSLADVVSAHARAKTLPERAVLLTFDDGVDDFRTHALPVLLRHKVQAVVFVPTAFVDDPTAWFWWDAVYAAIVTTDRQALPDSPIGMLRLGHPHERAEAVRHLRAHLKQQPWQDLTDVVRRLCDTLEVEPPSANVMSWAAIREIVSSGIDVCAHTRTHPHLDRVPLDVAREEIAGSIEDLRTHVGVVAPGFAYPSGQWTRDVATAVADCGVPLAFTTRRGSHSVATGDPMLIRRINVSRRTGLNAGRAFMHPWADRITERTERSRALADRSPAMRS